MSDGAAIILLPKSAVLDAKADNKADFFLEAIVNGESKFTEVAKNQGKLPTWTSQLVFPLTDQDFDTPELLVTIGIMNENENGRKELFGMGEFKLSQLKTAVPPPQTVTIYDKSNMSKGVVQVEIIIKRNLSILQKSTKIAKGFEKGTLVVWPKAGRFKRLFDVNTSLYLQVMLKEQAYKTNPADVSGKFPVWRDSISFDLNKYQELLSFQVLSSNDSEPDEIIGEAFINMDYISQNIRDYPKELIITLEKKSVETGQLTVELEYMPDVFKNPVKFFPPIGVKRGEYVCKKFKYSNPDNIKKTLLIAPADKSDLLRPRASEIIVGPKSFTEIRLKIYPPTASAEQKSRLDVVVKELNQIEETLCFRIVAL